MNHSYFESALLHFCVHSDKLLLPNVFVQRSSFFLRAIEMTRSVGLVGWRGMVGSVLMQRMRDENDLALIQPVFFSTTNASGAAPSWADGAGPLQNAYDVDALKNCLSS